MKEKIAMKTKIVLFMIALIAATSPALADDCSSGELARVYRSHAIRETEIDRSGTLCTGPGACWTYSTYRVDLSPNDLNRTTIYKHVAEQHYTGRVDTSLSLTLDGPECGIGN